MDDAWLKQLVCWSSERLRFHDKRWLPRWFLKAKLITQLRAGKILTRLPGPTGLATFDAVSIERQSPCIGNHAGLQRATLYRAGHPERT